MKRCSLSARCELLSAGELWSGASETLFVFR